ncbi:MAG: AraC family ligand binding domain-containing protein, partial [Puniceicoccales bacterium]
MQGVETFWKILNTRFFVNAEDWTWDSSSRTHYNFWLATQGGGEMRLNGRDYQIRPGVAFLLNRTDVVTAASEPQLGLIGNFAAHFIPDLPSEDGLRLLADRLNGRSFRDCLWLMPALRDLTRDFAFG